MRLNSYLSASALAALASAQTFTTCNPTQKDDCPNDPAMSKTFNTDFKAGANGVKGWKQTAGSLTYTPEGAQFTINKKGDAPTIQSEGYLHFGFVEVKMKAASGQGVISSIVLQSEDLDEVDWEFLGGVTNNVQMNYFGKGNTTTFDRMIEAPVTNTLEMHTFALNWTAEKLDYYVDSKLTRTLNFADAVGGKNYPQTPSTVRIGIWAGGDPSNEKGVIEWAGGETDYTKAPFSMVVDSVNVINYSPGTEYKWTDRSGSFQSIEVIGKGDEQGSPDNNIPLTPSANATGPGLASQIDVPSATANGTAPGATPPIKAPGSGSNSTSPTGPDGEPPCSCGIQTVIVTGTPPAGGAPGGSQPNPTLPPAVVAPGGGDSNPTAPKPTAPAQTTTPGGIVTDPEPAPSVHIPLAPSGALPGNTSTTAPPEFTGAASANKVGSLAVVVVAAAALFV